MAERVDCVVVGAGVVGLAIARRLAMAGRDVLVLEATDGIGNGASSRNSEVIHAGIYYPPGSLKAKVCVQGRHKLYRYCRERGIPHQRIGKLIVATHEDQAPQLAKYKAQAEQNGVDDLRWVSVEEAREMEPEVIFAAAVHSPSSGIIDSHSLMLALQGDAENAGATCVFNSPVEGGRANGDFITLDVGGSEPMSIDCGTVINAAGLTAPQLAARITGVPAHTVPPTHYAIGHYFALSGKAPFSRLVYPVARSDWLGVHVTVDLSGRVKFGPDFNWIDGIDYRFDHSLEPAFYEAIRRYYPGLKDGALTPDYTGIRAKITGPGEPPADFVVHGVETHGIPGLVNLFGIESPGLTSSMALADHVAALIGIQQPDDIPATPGV
ncbi:MAG: NAD(P)/FAD-dependent oxidoreductase [Rhodocyclaceae bacterium]|jgi:L-2-hydroxyglutarate oxidase LhgO|nr:NAD(P)/FAD-dependent oxidoreductase [Rhodocyclaceae bacterium]MCA3076536.1 NAD(P)/FAD-dependent oxidoreductase [Rhodocyclaceae bacterium]MCA3090115.1 NAD(P)/FAD-dependent oxidoreductase [Rhodocyclaceae bacterium]MCA3093881.1 NAD(P)/FAD-dependent oxidoreductase [Rhodocyclaceae bacterium]MCA3098754.1 NAD(P)/FAD-dependent oxidoreductase [Rhodocyclaceae bacterium]